MENSLLLLEKILEKQNYLVMELLRLGEEELEALKVDNLKQLQDIMQRQQPLSEELFQLEKERAQLQQELAREFNLEEQLTFQVLADAKIAGSEKVVAMGNLIRDNFMKLREINETNNLLIRQSLSYINKMLNLVAAKQSSTYDNNGQVNNTAGKTNLKLDKSI